MNDCTVDASCRSTFCSIASSSSSFAFESKPLFSISANKSSTVYNEQQKILVLHKSAEEISLMRSKWKEKIYKTCVFVAQKMQACQLILYLFFKWLHPVVLCFQQQLSIFWYQDCNYCAVWRALFSHCTTQSVSCPAFHWAKISSSQDRPGPGSHIAWTASPWRKQREEGSEENKRLLESNFTNISLLLPVLGQKGLCIRFLCLPEICAQAEKIFSTDSLEQLGEETAPQKTFFF